MIRRLLLSLAAAAALTMNANGPATSQPTGQGAPGMVAPFGVSVDQAVLSFLATNGLPGATVAVTRQGRLVWSKGYGYANLQTKTQMQPWHRSRIGSVSKVITALGAMKLVEAGVLGLNESIYGFPGPFVSLNSPWPGDATSFSVLQNSNDYWAAMLQGVQTLHHPNLVNSEMNKTIDWASKITVAHLLSHTSGLLGSGNTDVAVAYFKKSEDELTYKEAHLAVLMALRKDKEGNPIPPFASAPGTKWDYSNHGPGLTGHVIDELAGPGVSYRQYIEQNVLHPLGLFDVVPNNTSIGKLDAFPHGSTLDPDKPSVLGLASGGWSASARDLVRVMCALDRDSNNLRLLKHETITTMESNAVPGIASPLGWDSNGGGVLSKAGLIPPGGTALIRKYLPGSISGDEINVAIAINQAGPSPTDLIQMIAEAAAKAYIPAEYDLFDPKYRCYQPEPEEFQITAVSLLGFYPAAGSNPLPPKIAAKCPVEIKLVATFQHAGKGPVAYRFRFPAENKVSATYSTVIKGDPKDPLYDPHTVTHTVQLPLPAAVKPPPKGGGVPAGPGGLTVFDPPDEPLFPPQPKGPALPGKVAPPAAVPGVIGSVRLEVLKPSGVVVSNFVHYHIECETEMLILGGTVELRDASKTAPGCPRPAEVAASIRTSKAGPVSYRLACSGGDREWQGAMTAHQTDAKTFLGVVVHPIQIAQQEDVVCELRWSGFATILAADKRHYPCKVTGVSIPTAPPLPPGPPSGLKQPEPPRLVCIGGKVAGTAARPVCGCASGEVARQVAANRFQCAAQLVCEGGRVVERGRPPTPACECPSGMTAQKIVPVVPASQPVRVPSTAAKKDDEPDRYRCVRVAALPRVPPAGKPAPGGPPRIACAGGIVRANSCVCPSGTSLQNGVCRSSAAKPKTPVRSVR